jgi:hypothetical protein
LAIENLSLVIARGGSDGAALFAFALAIDLPKMRQR